MVVSRRKGKLILVLTVSLLVANLSYFLSLSCVVLASESDPSLNSHSVIEKDSKYDIPFEENDNPFKEKNLDHDLVRKQQLQLEKLQELVQNLTHLVSRLESRLSNDWGKPKLSSLSLADDEMLGFETIKVESGLAGKGEMRGRGGTKPRPISMTNYNTFWEERFQSVSAVKLNSIPTCISVLPIKDFEGLSKYFAVGDDKGKLHLFLRSGKVALEFDTFLDSEEPSPITAILSYLSVHKNESMIITGHGNGVIVMHRVWESTNEWSSLHMDRVWRFEIVALGRLQITMLELHHVGKKRYILGTDHGGRINVFNEDGTLYGGASSTRRPIAFVKQRLLFLTDAGAGSLDLRTMRLKESHCEGLNGSLVNSYAFDATDRTKAYGVTSEGEFVRTSLLGDVMNFKCSVRSKRRLEMDQLVALEAIGGYLLVANREKVLVYNVSPFRLLFSAGLDEVMAPFVQLGDVRMEKRMRMALIASDYEKLVVMMSLGNGYVAVYRCKLCVLKSELTRSYFGGSAVVLFFIAFLFGAWQFSAKKFSSRNSEIMELRSCTRYSGRDSRVGPNHYRTSPDTEYRFITVSELKYRGTNCS